MPAWLYILRLKSGRLYPGVTRDLNAPLTAHFASRACRTTTLDPPFELVHTERFGTLSEARKRENQLKRWSRAKKEALIAGDTALLQSLARRRTRYNSRLAVLSSRRP